MIWLSFLLFISLVNCQESNQNDDKLIFTQVLFRHGDRTIRKTYANDPYKDKSFWPEGFGHLTNAGKLREYELGQFFHRRYGKLLGTYAPDKVSILASYTDRTINSANLVLAALFPPEENQVWNEDLLWQPIAVHSIPKDTDFLIHAQEGCARYLQAREEYEEFPKNKELKEKNRELFKYVEKHAGQPIRTLEQLKDVHETLTIEYLRFNKTLPKWTEKVFVPGNAFERIANYWFEFQTGTEELKRLKSGFLLKDILDRFTNKTQSLLPDQLIQIYSGHDSTIASMLNTLNVFELHVPPYSSSVMFELYESVEGHYVQLFYRNSTADDLKPINIPGCGTKCTLEQLYDIYSDVLPSNTNEVCRLRANNFEL